MTISSTNVTKRPLTVQPQLTARAARFAARNPKLVDVIVAAALEAAAAALEPAGDSADGEASPESSLSAAPTLPTALQRFVQPTASSAEENFLNLTEAAEQLEISRPTVYAWIHDGRLLGWNATSRGPLVPAEQILGPRKVLEGIPQLLEIIEDPSVAWDFLTTRLDFLEPPQRPIDALKAGRIDEVLAAAQSHGTVFS
jgi:excisionase family DNA binding protein